MGLNSPLEHWEAFFLIALLMCVSTKTSNPKDIKEKTQNPYLLLLHTDLSLVIMWISFVLLDKKIKRFSGCQSFEVTQPVANIYFKVKQKHWKIIVLYFIHLPVSALGAGGGGHPFKISRTIFRFKWCKRKNLHSWELEIVNIT